MSAEVRKIVVAGAGLAGHECVSRLLADRSLDAEITWFGAEADTPYNRVLLTDLLAGRHAPHAIGLPTLSDPRLIVRSRRAVERIDRAARTVAVSGSGGREAVPYDRLVLATGADPILPPVRGSAVPLRTLGDVRTILRTLEAGVRRVAVVGGGPLGIQAACALASHGQAVELLHRGPHLLHRWLDAEAGTLLAGSLRAAGITVHCAVEVSAETGGKWPRADLVVVACGTKPRTRLADVADLPVDRGILVGDGCRTVGDDRIFAIGDCSQTGDTVYGLALPALDQARYAAETILADHHHTAARPSRHSPKLLRLRSHGVTGVETAVLAAGRQGHDPAMRFSDQHRRTHKSISLSPDGESVVGATLVGDVKSAAAISRLLTWPLPQPTVPAALLTSPAGSGERTLGSR